VESLEKGTVLTPNRHHEQIQRQIMDMIGEVRDELKLVSPTSNLDSTTLSIYSKDNL
jgi:hypothetical protein